MENKAPKIKRRYYFVIKKVDEEESNDPFDSQWRGRDFDVFQTEINADDMVELMQHLWEIAKRKSN